MVVLRVSDEDMSHLIFTQKLKEAHIDYTISTDSEYGDFTKYSLLSYAVDKKDEVRALAILRSLPSSANTKTPYSSKTYKIGLYGLIFFAIILICYAIIILL